MNRPTFRRTVTYDAPPPRKLARKYSSSRRVFRPRSLVPEKKEKELLFTPNLYFLTAGTQSSVNAISAIPTGSDITQRIGRKVRHDSLSVRALVAPRSIMTNPDCGFMCLILDRQANQNIPAFSDMFDDTTSAGNSGLNPRLTRSNQERFLVIWKKSWTCPNFANATATYIDEYIDLKKLKGMDTTCNYSGTGASVSDINSGALLFVFAQTNDAQQISGALNIRANIKYRFTDI